GQIDHPALQRIADLERRHRLWAANVVDLHLALAVGIDLVDEALKAAGIKGLLGEGGDGLQRHLLSPHRHGGGHEKKNRQRQPNWTMHALLPSFPFVPTGGNKSTGPCQSATCRPWRPRQRWPGCPSPRAAARLAALLWQPPPGRRAVQSGSKLFGRAQRARWRAHRGGQLPGINLLPGARTLA